MPIDDEKLAARMMRRLCAFPSFQPSKNRDLAEAYTKGIAKLLREFGYERVHDAIGRAVDRGGPFAPSVGDLRIYIPAVPVVESEVESEVAGESGDDEPFQVIDARFSPDELRQKAADFEQDGLLELAAQLREAAREIEQTGPGWYEQDERLEMFCKIAEAEATRNSVSL